MVWASVMVLPDPVTPRRVWYLCPRRRPAVNSAMALGWSPAGSNGAATSDFGLMGVGNNRISSWTETMEQTERTSPPSHFRPFRPFCCSVLFHKLPAELRKDVNIAVNVRLGVLDRECPLLLVARCHENPPVQQPGIRRGEELRTRLEKVPIVLHWSGTVRHATLGAEIDRVRGDAIAVD